MNQLIFTLRSKSSIFQNSILLSATTRGPKKKKGPAKSEAPESSDIVNIFKDRPDPVIYPTERYPPWLMKLLEENYSPDDVMMQIYRGERIPTGDEQWTLSRSFRRTYLNDQNKYMRNDWVYESEDDEGEDTGQADIEDMDQSVQAAGGAGAEAGKEGEKKDEKKEGGGEGGGADKDKK